MKSKLILISLLSVFILASCGNAAKEAEQKKQDSIVSQAREQARLDSIAAVTKYINDSLVAAGKAPLTEAEMAQRELAKDVSLNTSTPKDRKMVKSGGLKFRVNNVRLATEKIEDIVVKFSGYVVSSNLSNQITNQTVKEISPNQELITKEIVVSTNMVVKIPVDKLDTFFRALNPFIDFLDYRSYQADDITAQHMVNKVQIDRIEKFEKRQSKNIDTKSSKLKETTHAENDLLDRQLSADVLKVNNAELEYQMKYCSVNISIYQKPVLQRDVNENFDGYGDYRPNIFKRIGYSIKEGWSILEALLEFLFKLWGIVLLVVIGIFSYRLVNRFIKSRKSE